MAALLPFLFLVTTIPIVVFLSFLRQPISVPDEWSHIARAAQLADGIILTQVAEAGKPPKGSMDPSFRKLTQMVHERRREPLATAMPAFSAFRWSDARVLAVYNSAVYFPAPFVVASAVLKIGEMSNFTIARTLQWVSLANGLLSIAVAALAIAIAPRGKFLIFAVAALPMSLFSFASASPDGPIVVSTLLLFALVSRAVSTRQASVGALTVAALLAIVVAATKLPYLPLVLASLAAIWLAADAKRPEPSLLVGLLGLTVAVPLAWAFVSNAGAIDVSWGAGIADPGAQVAFLLHHPLAVLAIAKATLATYGWLYLQQMVGVLGWLDAPISRPSQIILLAALLILLVVDPISRRFGWMNATLLAAALVSGGAVFLSLYVAYNPVGALGPIEGVQGRYFLPILPFLAFLLPLRRGERTRSGIGFAVAIAVVLLSNIELTRTVIERYYL